MKTNPKLSLMKVIQQDFDAYLMSLFFLLTLLAILIINLPALMVAFAPFLILPLIVISVKYFYFHKMIASDVTVKAKVQKLIQPLARHRTIEIDMIDEESPKASFIVEMVYCYNGRDYQSKYRFRHQKHMPALVPGEETEILLHPKKPSKFIVKGFWTGDFMMLKSAIE